MHGLIVLAALVWATSVVYASSIPAIQPLRTPAPTASHSFVPRKHLLRSKQHRARHRKLAARAAEINAPPLTPSAANQGVLYTSAIAVGATQACPRGACGCTLSDVDSYVFLQSALWYAPGDKAPAFNPNWCGVELVVKNHATPTLSATVVVADVWTSYLPIEPPFLPRSPVTTVSANDLVLGKLAYNAVNGAPLVGAMNAAPAVVVDWSILGMKQAGQICTAYSQLSSGMGQPAPSSCTSTDSSCPSGMTAGPSGSCRPATLSTVSTTTKSVVTSQSKCSLKGSLSVYSTSTSIKAGVATPFTTITARPSAQIVYNQVDTLFIAELCNCGTKAYVDSSNSCQSCATASGTNNPGLLGGSDGTVCKCYQDFATVAKKNECACVGAGFGLGPAWQNPPSVQLSGGMSTAPVGIPNCNKCAALGGALHSQTDGKCACNSDEVSVALNGASACVPKVFETTILVTSSSVTVYETVSLRSYTACGYGWVAQCYWNTITVQVPVTSTISQVITSKSMVTRTQA